MIHKLLRTIVLVLIVAVLLTAVVGCRVSVIPATTNSNSTDTSTTMQEQIVALSEETEEKVEYSIGETSVLVWESSIGTSWIRVAVPVKNTGTVNLFLKNSTIDIENADGSLAATLNMVSVNPQIIAPGETAYYFEETTYNGASTEGLKVVPHVKADKAKVDLIRLDVSDLQIINDTFGAKIMGRVENTTGEEQALVYIVANIFDKDGKLLGQQFTILTDKLPAGEKIGFETSSLSSQLSSSNIATYEVIAFPYQYQFQ